MRRILQLTFLLIALAFALPNTALAQQRETTPETRDFSLANRLWYGTGGILGFSSNGQRSVFQVGVTPMVGYKLTDFLSVGPRISLIYSSYKIDVGNEVLRARPLDFGYGAFLRSRIYSGLFGQLEYEKLSFGNPNLESNSQGQLEYNVRRFNRDNAYLGLGWNSGQGAVGSEIMLLYNFNVPNNSIESEISIRAGLTWRF